MGSITLKPDREKSLYRRHPWIFSGAISKSENVLINGEIIDIFSSKGEHLGKGSFSAHSQISLRVLTFDPEEEISSDFFRKKIYRSIHARNLLNLPERYDAYRIINAESDGLPGIIVDKYDNYLVCQFLSSGAEYLKKEIVQQLKDFFPNNSIYERSDAEVRKKEGLPLYKGVIFGDEPPDLIEIKEDSLYFLVDIKNGHKTGFYLDQRDNRISVSKFSANKDILNCFSYSGGFGIWAQKRGASHIINIDSSALALTLIEKNLEINKFEKDNVENINGDVFQILRKYRDSRREFDIIILDPPKFAESVSQLKKAARGYKDINMMALKLIKPGGMLFTFSCSGLMVVELFQKIIADAALDAKREVQIIQKLTQSPDHPCALNFPEGEYLKGLALRVW